MADLWFTKQDRIDCEGLNIEYKCEYSENRLWRFKNLHGVKYLNICTKKISTENYIDEFSKVISDKNLSPELDETVQYWCYVLEEQ